MASIFVEVEENENCPVSIQHLFSALAEPRPVREVRLFDLIPAGMWSEITGWTVVGETCPALGVPVEDSGQGRAWLVYGAGDGGLRLKPSGAREPWGLGTPSQRGEPYLLLAEEEDIMWA